MRKSINTISYLIEKGVDILRFEPWQLAAIDEAGYNGIRDSHISKICDSLRMFGITEFDQTVFEEHCYRCGIDPANFTQEDLENLQSKLNE